MPPLLVVALFINGVEPMLPSPAFLDGGAVWVPARAVLTRLGCSVAWDEAGQRLHVQAGSGAATSLGDGGSGGDSGAGSYVYKKVRDSLYIPIQVVGQVTGASVVWDVDRKRVTIRAVPSASESRSMSVGDLLALGPDAIGLHVSLSGTYGGPASVPALSAAQPPRGAVWRVRSSRQPVRCCGGGPELSATPAGASMVVRGTVAGYTGSEPVLDVDLARCGPEAPGLSCRLTAARSADGAQLRARMAISNSGAAPALLRQQDVKIEVSSIFGSEDMHFDINALEWPIRIAHGKTIEVFARTPIADRKAGEYRVVGEVPTRIMTNEAVVALGQ